MRRLTSGLLVAAFASLAGCTAANWVAVPVEDLDIDLDRGEEIAAREYVFDTDLPPEQISSGSSAGGDERVAPESSTGITGHRLR